MESDLFQHIIEALGLDFITCEMGSPCIPGHKLR